MENCFSRRRTAGHLGKGVSSPGGGGRGERSTKRPPAQLPRRRHCKIQIGPPFGLSTTKPGNLVPCPSPEPPAACLRVHVTRGMPTREPTDRSRQPPPPARLVAPSEPRSRPGAPGSRRGPACNVGVCLASHRLSSRYAFIHVTHLRAFRATLAAPAASALAGQTLTGPTALHPSIRPDRRPRRLVPQRIPASIQPVLPASRHPSPAGRPGESKLDRSYAVRPSVSRSDLVRSTPRTAIARRPSWTPTVACRPLKMHFPISSPLVSWYSPTSVCLTQPFRPVRNRAAAVGSPYRFGSSLNRSQVFLSSRPLPPFSAARKRTPSVAAGSRTPLRFGIGW